MSIARTVRVTPLPRFAPPSASQRFTTRPWLISFFLLGFLMCAPLGRAQDGTKDAPKDLGQASLEELGNIQVYSASKHMQSTSDAPSSVTVVTADEIQKYGYRTLADILESVRGFYITYDRDYTFVGVRGFGRLGTWNSSILLLVDGHRINDNVLGDGFVGPEFLVDLDLVDRVEIIRGPSSSLYRA
jgi:outer membrane receptor for ferrienterochelin and colicins